MYHLNNNMIYIRDDISYYKSLYKRITGSNPESHIVQDYAKLSQDERSAITWDTANLCFCNSKKDKQEKINTLKQYGQFTAKIISSSSNIKLEVL